MATQLPRRTLIAAGAAAALLLGGAAFVGSRDARGATTTGATTTSATARPAATGTPAPTALSGALGTSGRAAGRAVPGGGTARTLIVYDNSGEWGYLGEVYAAQVANLASRFGAWTAHPVGSYTAGEVAGYTAMIYIGSTYDEPLPATFLDDVTRTNQRVVWINNNIWQLTARDPGFTARRGFTWKAMDTSAIAQVRYRGTVLTRDPANRSGIMDTVIHDRARAIPVAEAIRPDGRAFPWGVRSGNLTYLGELPFTYVTHDDRYLAFADLLFDVLAPRTPPRHRALVRIEDVGPNADPAQLRAIADYLYSRRVPFTVAVYPRHRNPHGVDNDGVAEDYTLRERPAVVDALRYLQTRGGTLLMHGYTHQYESLKNPYDGVSGNDFEFFAAHVDGDNSVSYDGAVPQDSPAWARARLGASATEFTRAGLAAPSIFEFPHYAGSAADYRAVQARFGARYDRGLYFPGVLSGATVDHTQPTGQFFPYPVRDVYGTPVIPENIGNVTEAYNNHAARGPADLIASAKRNLVVRDGVASFFYHPFLGTAQLKQIVEGLTALGYRFVPASAMLTG